MIEPEKQDWIVINTPHSIRLLREAMGDMDEIDNLGAVFFFKKSVF